MNTIGKQLFIFLMVMAVLATVVTVLLAKENQLAEPETGRQMGLSPAHNSGAVTLQVEGNTIGIVSLQVEDSGSKETAQTQKK